MRDKPAVTAQISANPIAARPIFLDAIPRRVIVGLVAQQIGAIRTGAQKIELHIKRPIFAAIDNTDEPSLPLRRANAAAQTPPCVRFRYHQ